MIARICKRPSVEANVASRVPAAPIAVTQLNPGAPVVRLAGVMTIEVPGGVVAFTQSFAAAVLWTVNHNLGRSPASVRVLSPGNAEMVAEVVEISLNQIVVFFASPRAGRVVIV